MDEQQGSGLPLEDWQNKWRRVLTPGWKTRAPPNRRTSGVGKHGELKRQMGRTWPETAGTAGSLTPPLAHTPVIYYVHCITLALRTTLTQARASLKHTMSKQGIEYCWNKRDIVYWSYTAIVWALDKAHFALQLWIHMCMQYSEYEYDVQHVFTYTDNIRPFNVKISN